MSCKRLVRRRGGYSDRNGIVPISKEMQLIEFDKNTRIKLKNFSFKLIDKYRSYFDYYEGRAIISELFADEVFCIETRGRESEYDKIEKLLKEVFDTGEYDEILDVIEFIATNIKIKNSNLYPEYINLYVLYNKLFENEYIGYRFVNGLIVRITNKEEIESIEEASSSKYLKVNEHINKAIICISESGKKDYKNSIKESITAVETLCSIITGDNSGSLGKTINVIAKDKALHPSLKDAISKLFGFASDEPGIRHGTRKDGNDIDFDEAKFILVICSAIINYFIGVLAD